MMVYFSCINCLKILLVTGGKSGGFEDSSFTRTTEVFKNSEWILVNAELGRAALRGVNLENTVYMFGDSN